MDQRTLEELHRFFPAAEEMDPQNIADLFDLAELVDEIQRRIRDLAELTGMPSLHFFLLEHLALSGGSMPLGSLVQTLHLPKQSATYIVDRLEKDGFVERRADTQDRRRLEIALTQKGRQRTKAGFGPFYGAMLKALQSVSKSDRAALRRGLGQFLDGLQDPNQTS